MNTFVYASGKIVLTIPVAFLLAVFLNKKQRGSSFLKTVYFMPTIISISVMSLIFYLIFNTYNGTLNIMLKNAGIITESIGWLSKEHAMLTVIIVGAWGGIGNYMVYFLAGLQSIPKEVYESADIDGTNGWQRMLYITLPMMGSVLQFILMLAILIAFQDMQSIMVLTEGGPSSATEVMFLYVYKLFFPISAGEAIPPEYGYGAATGIASSAIVGVFTCIYLYLSRKLNEIY
ncbi:MAG: sugar ABC transporter permease [Clostridiaceae bacterium]